MIGCVFQAGEIHHIQEATAEGWVTLPGTSLTQWGCTQRETTAPGPVSGGTGVIHSPQALVFLHQQRKP